MTTTARNQTEPEAESIDEKGVSVSSGSVGGRPASGGQSLDEKGLEAAAKLLFKKSRREHVWDEVPEQFRLQWLVWAEDIISVYLSTVSGAGPGLIEAKNAIRDVLRDHAGDDRLPTMDDDTLAAMCAKAAQVSLSAVSGEGHELTDDEREAVLVALDARIAWLIGFPRDVSESARAKLSGVPSGLGETGG